MQSQWLAHVATVLYDPVHANRQLTRNSLFTLGFRDIDTPANAAELKRAFELADYDLCVIDVSTDEDTLCAFIRDIRNGQVGRNPFIVILATTWRQSGDLVRKVINAGADDLVLRPLSTGQLKARIRQQVEARKGFVVTSAYVGPDRRRDPGRAGEEVLLSVPNTLRVKAHDGHLGAQDTAAIEAVRRQVERQRVEQHAFQIGIAARLIGDHLAHPMGFEAALPEAETLASVIDELRGRTRGPDLASVAPLVDSLAKAAQELGKALVAARPAEAAAKPLALIGELARAVQLALNPQKDESSLSREISHMVSRIHARRVAQKASDGPQAVRA